MEQRCNFEIRQLILMLVASLQITVFSAPNYCDEMGNKGAFIRYADPISSARSTMCCYSFC